MSRKEAAHYRLSRLTISLFLFVSAKDSSLSLFQRKAQELNEAAKDVSPLRLQPQQFVHLSTLHIPLFLTLSGTPHKNLLYKIHALVHYCCS